MVLHQGRIERFFLDSISAHSDIVVERGVLPETLEFDESQAEDDDAFPITVKLRHLSEEEATPKQNATSANGAGMQDGLFRSNLAPDDTEELIKVSKLADKAGSTETIQARYMVGCDGAHSWVRNQLGFKLRGESTDYIWGVLDVIPITVCDMPLCTFDEAKVYAADPLFSFGIGLSRYSNAVCDSLGQQWLSDGHTS